MVFYYLFHGLSKITLLILFLLIILILIITLPLMLLLLLLLLLPIIIIIITIIIIKIVLLMIEIITIIILIDTKVTRLIRQLVIRSFGPVTAVQSHSFQVVYVSVKAMVILFQVDICLKKRKQ